MSRVDRARHEWVLIGVALAVFLIIAIALWTSGTLRESLLGPMVRAWSAFRQAVSFLSERVQWTALLAIALVVILQLASTRAPRTPDEIPRRPPERFPRSGPAMRVAHLLSRSRRSRFARERTLAALRDLAVRVVACHYGVSPSEARQRVDAGTWSADSASCELLRSRPHHRSPSSGRDFLQRVDHVLSQIEHMYQEV